MIQPIKYAAYTGMTAILLSMLVGCGQSNLHTEGPSAPQEFPVITIAPKDAELYFDYPATVRGQQNVDIRPKIDGYISDILVDEGAKVKKGQLLFRISNPVYEQEVVTAQASIKRAEAAVNTAQMKVLKTEPLVKKEIISEFDLQTAHLELDARQAELAQARAALRNASTNLGYTTIYSPAAGVIGILPYKKGSLVGSTAEQPLTVLSDISNVHVYFSFSEKQLLDLIDNTGHSGSEDALKQLPPVQLVLANGSIYPEQGSIETTGGQINSATGAISMRALFSNKSGIIRSGSSATIRISQPVKNALIVPAKATYEVQGKKFVVKIDSTGTAQSVEIKVNALPAGDAFIVKSGLQRGDRIVSQDVGTIKDGDKIKPKSTVTATAAR
ncbi:efflux RND transporter periplasmic adaptor subunit [Chitinophaga arvensicola]|uniref:Membrane fusion protein, multidrug efflux system n=1 Tax=Chitinophaga arvensicola TaxID=29529 RepID=A0A1I0RV90_9BACT|nr:efflux RND transporter periplasmic adaptor subunit [Chitinophaga arvensicola]SEW45235.1 membrane fusion protein, multidrug efflux system [Chitinophaga arvensicola]